jgi:hypothetical protein
MLAVSWWRVLWGWSRRCRAIINFSIGRALDKRINDLWWSFNGLLVMSN